MLEVNHLYEIGLCQVSQVAIKDIRTLWPFATHLPTMQCHHLAHSQHINIPLKWACGISNLLSISALTRLWLVEIWFCYVIQSPEPEPDISGSCSTKQTDRNSFLSATSHTSFPTSSHSIYTLGREKSKWQLLLNMHKNEKGKQLDRMREKRRGWLLCVLHWRSWS